MGFDIPMNTSGATSLAAMAQSMLGGNNPMQQNMNQTMGMNQGMQQPMQNNMGQPMQNNMNMQQPMQGNMGMNQGMQTSMNNMNMGQPMQNNMNQPMQQAVVTQQPMNTPRPAGGGVHLKKGSKTAIVGANGQQLSAIRIGLGWDVINQACDLDASAFMLGADGRVIGDDWFVFYGQTTSPDNSIQHSGDSQGHGTGDDEVIDINLAGVNPQVQKIVFVVTINEALENGLNFSMVQNAYVRVMDKSNGNELMRFNLTDYYQTVTAMVVGEVYKHNGAWKFNAVGDGVAKDLAGLCGMYGVNVAD